MGVKVIHAFFPPPKLQTLAAIQNYGYLARTVPIKGIILSFSIHIFALPRMDLYFIVSYLFPAIFSHKLPLQSTALSPYLRFPPAVN